jgi:hypothetical protein
MWYFFEWKEYCWQLRPSRNHKMANSELAISISGLEKFPSAIAPSSPSQTRRMERVEIRKAGSDAMTSLMTALTQINKSIGATKSSSERILLKHARRKVRRQLAKASADIGTCDEDINYDDSDDDDNNIEIEPDERNVDFY